MNESNTQKKVWTSILAIGLLLVMLVVTTYAFVASFISVEDNLFETARVEIDLNNGIPVFDDKDFVLEPGRSNIKDFTVNNLSTVDVYYRLYLDNVQGDLQDVLSFEIYDGDKLLFEADMADFNQDEPFVSDEILKVGETKVLSAVVIMDTTAGNRYQSKQVTFDMVVSATQVRNNPTQQFE